MAHFRRAQPSPIGRKTRNKNVYWADRAAGSSRRRKRKGPRSARAVRAVTDSQKIAPYDARVLPSEPTERSPPTPSPSRVPKNKPEAAVEAICKRPAPAGSASSQKQCREYANHQARRAAFRANQFDTCVGLYGRRSSGNQSRCPHSARRPVSGVGLLV
jgi:hypothetical protein